MPVTKTAKRALRSSKNKESVNKLIVSKLEAAIRLASKSKNVEKIKKAFSLTDKASKKKVIHKNKAARIKSSLARLLSKTASKAKTTKKK
jgi:ribosomal protein S20